MWAVIYVSVYLSIHIDNFDIEETKGDYPIDFKNLKSGINAII
jgi:hypothetical protein